MVPSAWIVHALYAQVGQAVGKGWRPCGRLEYTRSVHFPQNAKLLFGAGMITSDICGLPSFSSVSED